MIFSTDKWLQMAEAVTMGNPTKYPPLTESQYAEMYAQVSSTVVAQYAHALSLLSQSLLSLSLFSLSLRNAQSPFSLSLYLSSLFLSEMRNLVGLYEAKYLLSLSSLSLSVLSRSLSLLSLLSLSLSLSPRIPLLLSFSCSLFRSSSLYDHELVNPKHELVVSTRHPHPHTTTLSYGLVTGPWTTRFWPGNAESVRSFPIKIFPGN
jgi:hypothetical protein